MKKRFNQLFLYIFFSGFCLNSIAQTNYFVDGYHGGIYGHYPLWVTKFIADSLSAHKDWKVNLEIEPESWDTIEVNDSKGYAAIKKYINNSTCRASIEYVNPSFAQSYLYNISAESIIRQFQYGIKKLRQHFPEIAFTTYSSEEPCFTSALPQILKSLGIKYASLKNPNTCWGGYVRAYGGEELNWVGPDGSSILTVPRYASEKLQKSTWQTLAWNNSVAYINAATQQGILNPVGMCLQDAGWRNGPWLEDHKASTKYTTWRNYFKLIENKKGIDNWRLSQEDINVSLVWGSQILQRIAQEVRTAENTITRAEKIAAMAKLYANVAFPEARFDDAWRTLLLSQHHDCWIVPYNRHNGKSWAAHVKEWTDNTNIICDDIISQSLSAISKSRSNNSHNIFALNTTAANRNEVIAVHPGNNSSVNKVTYQNKKLPVQIVINNDSSKTLLFKAQLPPMGYNTYTLVTESKQTLENGAYVKEEDGNFVMQTDLYKLVIDKQRGSINQLIAKKIANKNFVSGDVSVFNTLRGNFFNDGGLITSTQSKPKITIVENGPLQIKLQIEGMIGENNFIQTIQLTTGQKRIDCFFHIDYKNNIGIGEDYKQHWDYNSTDLHKAFYNDTCKLLLVFPLNLKNQKVYKDAPLDVTESKLPNTFYDRWDSIKNNVIDNWVDVTDGENKYGIALMSDHVTSYSHGENFPLALTVQYAGVGLWGKNYAVAGPTDIHYALIPHEGKWNRADINNETDKWNEPIVTSIVAEDKISNAFVYHIDKGIAITTMYYRGNDLYVRIVNSSSQSAKHHFNFNCYAEEMQFVELNDKITSAVKFKKDQKVTFDCSIPLFGFKTIKLVNARR